MRQIIGLSILAGVVFASAVQAQPCFGPGGCLPIDEPELEVVDADITYDRTVFCTWSDGFNFSEVTVPRGNKRYPLRVSDECVAIRAAHETGTSEVDQVCVSPGPCGIQPPSEYRVEYSRQLHCVWSDGYEMSRRVVPRGVWVYQQPIDQECKNARDVYELGSTE